MIIKPTSRIRRRLATGLLAATVALAAVGLSAGAASAYGIVSSGPVAYSSYIINPDTLGCGNFGSGYESLAAPELVCNFSDVYSLKPGNRSTWVLKHTSAFAWTGSAWSPVSHPHEWQKVNCNQQCTIGADVSIYWSDYYTNQLLLGGEDAVHVSTGRYLDLVTDLFFWDGSRWVKSAAPSAEHRYDPNGNTVFMKTGGYTYH